MGKPEDDSQNTKWSFVEVDIADQYNCFPSFVELLVYSSARVLIKKDLI